MDIVIVFGVLGFMAVTYVLAVGALIAKMLQDEVEREQDMRNCMALCCDCHDAVESAQ